MNEYLMEGKEVNLDSSFLPTSDSQSTNLLYTYKHRETRSNQESLSLLRLDQLVEMIGEFSRYCGPNVAHNSVLIKQESFYSFIKSIR